MRQSCDGRYQEGTWSCSLFMFAREGDGHEDEYDLHYSIGIHDQLIVRQRRRGMFRCNSSCTCSEKGGRPRTQSNRQLVVFPSSYFVTCIVVTILFCCNSFCFFALPGHSRRGISARSSAETSDYDQLQVPRPTSGGKTLSKGEKSELRLSSCELTLFVLDRGAETGRGEQASGQRYAGMMRWSRRTTTARPTAMMTMKRASQQVR